MKEIIKTVGAAIAVVGMSILFTGLAIDAADKSWEYNARTEFEVRYNHRYDETGFDLLNPTYLDSIQAQMPKGFKFADWGYPEFDVEVQ